MYQTYAELARAEINILNMTVDPRFTTVVFEYSWRPKTDGKKWAKAAFTFVAPVNHREMNESIIDIVTESRKLLEGEEYVTR